MGFQFQIQWFLVNSPEIPFPSETQNYIKKEWKSKGGHLLRISVKLKTRKKTNGKWKHENWHRNVTVESYERKRERKLPSAKRRVWESLSFRCKIHVCIWQLSTFSFFYYIWLELRFCPYMSCGVVHLLY